MILSHPLGNLVRFVKNGAAKEFFKYFSIPKALIYWLGDSKNRDEVTMNFGVPWGLVFQLDKF
jgi:hypothetical protein